MSEYFLNAHTWWQYLVLVGMVVSLVFAFRSSMMDSTAETLYRVTAGVVDIQVALGIVVWLDGSDWSLGFIQGSTPSPVWPRWVCCMPSSGGHARVIPSWPTARFAQVS